MASRARMSLLTADDLDDIPPDGNRYEIIHGVLRVTPSPSRAHQHILGALLVLLRPYAAALGITVYVAPLDVRASPVTQVEPDLLAVPRDVDRAITTRWSPMSVLMLAVEILSPSTARVDRGRKRELYMAEGVAQYWIVDLYAQTVEVWAPGADNYVGLTAADVLRWHPVAGVAPLAIDLGALFGELA